MEHSPASAQQEPAPLPFVNLRSLVLRDYPYAGCKSFTHWTLGLRL